MAKRRVARKTGDCELTLTEWHEVLSEIVDLTEESAVQRTMVHFLRTSKSGKACLEGAKRLRPDLEIGAGLDLEEVLAAYDTMKLLAQLIAEPRCGTDPTFYVWKDIWKSSWIGPSDYYPLAIEMSHVLEARSETEAEKVRLQQVRAALENEFSLEQRFQDYLTFRQATIKPNAKR